MLQASPDSQVVLSGLHEIRDIAAISTEPCHKWRIIRISIPNLNKICLGVYFLAIYIHHEEGDVDICPNGLRDEVDTVCQIRVRVWV